VSVFLDASTLDPAGTYRLLVGSVVPRPIAWVTSGVAPKPLNLAPFSSFTWVSQHPAMLGFTINRRPSGRKDTIRNIEEDGEYVVNIADESLLLPLHASSEHLPADESEVGRAGLETAPSTLVSVPRLAAAPVAMECRWHRTIEFSPTGGEFVVGTVVGWHIREDVLVDGRISTDRLRPLARLAGPRYTGLGTITDLPPVPGG
jgi:flavin reductase (DIM6/NTAB) family NADH-FMN oxidoreductase RutF